MTDAEERIRRHLSEGAAAVEADEEVYRRLRQEAGARSRRRRWIIGAGALGTAAALVLAVVVVRDKGSEKVEVLAPVITTTTSPTSTTTIPRHDWDGVRYDFGTIKLFLRVDTTRLLVFDRVQLESGSRGYVSGPDFTEEPVVCCHTDVIYQNDNPMLRTYRVHDDVEVLINANEQSSCSGEENPQPPRWERRSFGDLEAAFRESPYKLDEVSLSFDGEGAVTRIRVSFPC